MPEVNLANRHPPLASPTAKQPGRFGTSIATALYRPSYGKEAAEDAWQRCCLSGIKS